MIMKICIAGVGAIGGVLAAVLGRKYGSEVSLLARGKKAAYFREHGITLYSEAMGEIHASVGKIAADGTDLGIQQIIFVCVKNYSLDSICEKLKSAIDENSILIPVMNGTESGERLRTAFPDSIVLDSIIYCNTKAEEDFSVIQRGGYAYIYLGTKNKEERYQKAARDVVKVLLAADMDCRLTDKIETEIWRKYILNCAFNSICARYSTTAGVMRADKKMTEDFFSLLKETYAVGKATGIELPDDLIEKHTEHFWYKFAPEATSSLRWDVDGGKQSELDAFSGSVIRRADALGISVPITKEYHEAILKKIGQ